jgi:hypothetical protein
MRNLEPENGKDDPEELRGNAVEALRRAARQDDPREFERLTRYALRLIERARAIRQDRRRVVSNKDGEAARTVRRMAPTESPGREPAATVGFIDRLRQLFSRNSGR